MRGSYQPEPAMSLWAGGCRRCWNDAMTSARTSTVWILGLAAACWALAARQLSGMDMGTETELGSLGFFVAVWVPMMAAMMLPGGLPAVLRPRGRALAA